MKPLPAAPRTPEDRMIWLRLMHGKMPPLPLWSYREQDRRDAHIMCWLQVFSARHYSPDCVLPPEVRLPIVHLFVRMDPEWPAGHYGIDLT